LPDGRLLDITPLNPNNLEDQYPFIRANCSDEQFFDIESYSKNEHLYVGDDDSIDYLLSLLESTHQP